MKASILRAALAAATFLSASAYAAGLTIYTQPDFTGQQHTFRAEAGSLVHSGVEDQASSARIDSGQWQFCTQPEFKGDCMTLGPGDYSRLDARVFHKVESVRRVGGDERNQRYSRYSGYDEAIGPLAKDAFHKNKELRAVIRADKKVEHGRVIHVLDLLKRAGIAKIAFAVSPQRDAVPVEAPH